VEAEDELPFGDLPPARSVLLTENRIEAAVVEIRFVDTGAEISPDAAASMLALLSERTGVTRLETAEQRELSMTFSAGQPQPSVDVTSRGWRFASPDETLLITVMPTVAMVQVRGYERWSTSLRPQLEAMLAAIDLFSSSAIVQRLGLRYINRLTGTPGEPASAWAARIAPAFRGALDEPVLGGLLRGAHQQLELELEPDVGALIRHGLVPNPADNEVGYLVDVDVFDTASRAFDADRVVGRVQRLNRTALRLFMRMLTDEQIDDMDPVAIDADVGTIDSAGRPVTEIERDAR
jgi:uncharacterized protein (TIGR04255 family)